jgi:hypothetical protein
MSVLVFVTKQNLTLHNKGQYILPNAAWASLNTAHPWVTLPQPLAQTLLTRLLISKVTKIWRTLMLTCAKSILGVPKYIPLNFGGTAKVHSCRNL